MGELVTFASNGDEAQGYLAVPGSGAGPGVVVIQEWWGLVPHVRDLADRFAAEGFIALAPDLYHGESTTEPDEAAKRAMALDRRRAARDIAGAAAHLTGWADVLSEHVATVGFCMGGSLAIWSAEASDRISTMVGFYPAMGWDDFAPEPADYGGTYVQLHLDEHEGGAAAPGIVAAMEALRGAGATVEPYDYAGTGHAFFNDTRPEVYDADAAALAWSRTLAFIREHLE
ncbi:MAG: carboxymethylenebutenolidase [Frankiaceae bacterium]|nr:carboxymethylenebutenolidase [Frankiaceae bacterium]